MHLSARLSSVDTSLPIPIGCISPALDRCHLLSCARERGLGVVSDGVGGGVAPTRMKHTQFIEPCVRSFGQRQVYDSLLKYVTDGTDFEKAGAINAAYWVRDISRAMRHNPERGRMSQAATTDPTLDDAKERFRRAMLSEFVANENVDVRRSIAAILPLDVFGYPDDLKPLVSQAIDIARQHPDGYIRHRVGVQLADVAEPIAFEALPRRAPQAPM